MLSNSRNRLLAVSEILRRYTNEQHPMTATDIIEKLNLIYNISADRRSVYEDIQAIIAVGFDISTYGDNGKGFYLRECEFEFSELRMLVDAVLSARFISKSHSKKLVNKIKKLTNKYDEKRLEQVNFLNNRIKCNNASVFLTIDILSEAIEKGERVSFKYLDYDIQKNMVLKDNKIRHVSPFGIIWMNDYYYLVGKYIWLDSLTHFRIDKIKDILLTEIAAEPINEIEPYKNGFDIASYANTHVNMFSGDEERIELKCSNYILHDIIERFGDDAVIKPAEEGYFTAVVKGVQEGLLYFVLQFGTNIEVIKPERFRQLLKKTIVEIKGKYFLSK